MQRPIIDRDYLTEILFDLLEIPSPSGHTDGIVQRVSDELARLGIRFELTRRGAIRADLEGAQHSPDRAVVAHLDTLGAMVKELKANGRLRLAPVGHWSARFAEGARVTALTEHGPIRGSVLPLKASGHTFGTEIDTQPVGWEHVELRPDIAAADAADLARAGLAIGDFVAFDAAAELTETGFVNARHLDDKAGVACILAAAKAVCDERLRLPVDCHLLFTISEEVGSGASGVLHGDVAEMVAVDNGTQAEGQNSKETGVTIAMMDSSGPFDYHLTRRLLTLCREHDIAHQRDVFNLYRTDAASAIEAGNDIRTALVCFGLDASHGYERVHLHALESVAALVGLYMQSEPISLRDKDELAPVERRVLQG